MSALYRAGAIRGGCEDARVLCKSPDNLEIFEEIIAVAGGKQTKSEAQGIGEEEFCPWPIGPVL